MGKKVKHTSVNFNVQFTPKEKINNEFTLCTCNAFGLGKNRNYSHISKENMDRCKSTLNYAPVVGHLIEKYDDEGNKVGVVMGGHDYEIDTTDWTYKPVTVPFGVVVDGSLRYETIKEYADNKEREYLCCDVILWTGRYPELLDAIYDEETYFNESAELTVEEYRPLEEDSNYYDITDFTFSALCLLCKSDNAEDNVEPCFIEAKVQPINYSLSNEFAKSMDEMKEQLSFCFKNQHSDDSVSTTDEFDIDNEKDGGNSMAENETIEVVEDVTEDVVEETVEETEETTDEPETIEEATDDTTEEESVIEETNEDYSALYSELKDLYDALVKEFAEYKATYSTPNEEVDELKEFKATKEAEARQIAEDEIFAKYSDVIGETEEYSALKDSAADYEIDALEKECLYIVGKYAITKKDNKKETESIKFSLESKEETVEEPYGGLLKKYRKMEEK